MEQHALWQGFVAWLESETIHFEQPHLKWSPTYRARWRRAMRNTVAVTKWLANSEYGTRLYPIFSHYTLKISAFPYHDGDKFLGFPSPMLKIDAFDPMFKRLPFTDYEVEYHVSLTTGEPVRKKCRARHVQKVLVSMLARLEQDSQVLGASYR